MAEYTRHKQEEKERQKEAKKRRKKKSNQHETREVDWNVIYDPEQPVRLDDYRGSLEELDAKYEWKQRLHAHERKKNKTQPDSGGGGGGGMRASSEQQQPPPDSSKFRKFAAVPLPRSTLNILADAFAPPSNYDFAPPQQQQRQQQQQQNLDDDEDDYMPSGGAQPPRPPPQSYKNAPPPRSLSNNPGADDEDDDYEPPPAAPVAPSATLPGVAGDGYYVKSDEPRHEATLYPRAAQPPAQFAQSAQSMIPSSQLPGLAYPPPFPPIQQGVPFPPAPWLLPPGAVPPPPPSMAYPAPPSMAYPAPPPPQPAPGMQIPPPPPPFFAAAQQQQQHLPPAVESTPSVIIARAPVRYTQPSATAADPTQNADAPRVGGLGFGSTDPSTAAQMSPDREDVRGEDEEEEEEAPRSRAPGQKGFAKRLLQKYGWKEGEGLGASGDGITTILQHQTQKRKKKSDNDGGGWSGPAVGRIVGGKKRKIEGKDGEDEEAADGIGGKWSIVARFEGMLQGLDLDHEIGEGSLMQDIGEKMAEYGHVERLFIFKDAAEERGGPVVFVKFTSALSAYRAVQASHERDFLSNGRRVRSGFWDEDKFEREEYV